LLTRCLHLLTLGTHEAADAKLDGSPDGARFCKAFFAAWREPSAAPPLAAGPGGLAGARCLLLALRALPATAWAADATVARALKWLLQQAARLDAPCAAALQHAEGSAGGGGGGLSLEARRKAARERAMAAMAAKASAFMASAQMDDSDSDDSDDVAAEAPQAAAAAAATCSDEDGGKGGTSGTSGGGTAAAAETDASESSLPATTAEPSEFECIICREASEARPLGLLGMAQVCRTVGGVGEAGGAGGAGVGAFGATRPRRRSGVAVTCCGHALHYDCYEAYFASTVRRSPSCALVGLQPRGVSHDDFGVGWL
jgi:hypothetical protein